MLKNDRVTGILTSKNFFNILEIFVRWTKIAINRLILTILAFFVSWWGLIKWSPYLLLYSILTDSLISGISQLHQIRYTSSIFRYISGTFQVYCRYISAICYFLNIFLDVSWVYLMYISAIPYVYLRHIAEIYQAFLVYLRVISGISEVYIRHIWGSSRHI